MNYDKVIFGDGCEFSTNSYETQLNNNVIIVGPSGSGKTMSYAEPKLINLKNSNMLLKLSKRRLIDKYTPLLEKRGYRVEVLDLINPKKSTCAFDPLWYLKSDMDVSHLAEALVNLDPKKGKPNNADPYWDETAISLVSALIDISLAIDDNPTLSNVIRYIKGLKIEDYGSTITTSLDQTMREIEAQKPDHPAIAYWRAFSDLPARTARCVYGALVTSIDKTFTPEILEMMDCENKLDFKRLANEKTVLFVLTSAVSTSLHSFSNLFFSYAIKELFELAEKEPSGRLPIPMDILFDDFAVGGTILNFENHISIMREKQMSVSLLVQSESQLASIYGSENATTIINNCDSYIYMGGVDLQTAKNMSQRLNRPLEEVLYMPLGKVVVIRRGSVPVITQRYNIIKNESFKKITADYESRIANQAVVDAQKNQPPEAIRQKKDNDEVDLEAMLDAVFQN